MSVPKLRAFRRQWWASLTPEQRAEHARKSKDPERRRRNQIEREKKWDAFVASQSSAKPERADARPQSDDNPKK